MQSVIVTQNSATVPAGSYVPVNSVPTTIDRYHERVSVGFGIVQIIVGLICVVLSAVSVEVLYFQGYGLLFHGVWIGALFIVTGCLGILAGNAKTKCKIVAYMVLCIISTSVSVALLSIGIVEVFGSILTTSCSHQACEGNTSNSQKFAIAACLMVSAIAEGCMGSTGAVLCCIAGFCCCKKPTEPAFPHTNYLPNNGQIMYFSSTQQLQVPQPPTTVTPRNQQGILYVAEWIPADPPPYSASRFSSRHQNSEI